MKMLFPLLPLSTYLYHLSCDQGEEDLNPVLPSPYQAALLAAFALLAFVWGPVPDDCFQASPVSTLISAVISIHLQISDPQVYVEL